MKTSPLPVKGFKFWPMPHILHTGHPFRMVISNLRGPVTLIPIAERLAVEQSLPVLKTEVFSNLGSKPDPAHARRTLCLYATAAVDYDVVMCVKACYWVVKYNTPLGWGQYGVTMKMYFSTSTKATLLQCILTIICMHDYYDNFKGTD